MNKEDFLCISDSGLQDLLLSQNPFRTHLCKNLLQEKIGTEAQIAGWIISKRDHGKILFIELKDFSGQVQCVFENDLITKVVNLPVESSICVLGTLQTYYTKNNEQAIEIAVKDIYILTEAPQEMPFPIHSTDTFNNRQDLRFLCLRSQKLQQNLRNYSNLINFLRNYCNNRDFLEINTPILGAPSPEGARDYIVPSRKFPGKFYALPQAPQIYKQLIATNGIERYFQVAPCFRDEDSRSDRLIGEFYQFDLEMAFVKQEQIMLFAESMIKAAVKRFFPSFDDSICFPKLSYESCMKLYGSDKPDLRNPLKILNLTYIFRYNPPEVFQKTFNYDGCTLGILIKDGRDIDAKLFQNIKEYVIEHGGPGLVYIFRDKNGYKGPLATSLTNEHKKYLDEILAINNGLILISMFPIHRAYKLAGELRELIGQKLNLIDQSKFKFLWIDQFPMFEKNVELNSPYQVEFSHNPFSKPYKGHIQQYKNNPEKILCKQYDLVLNGKEIASGAERQTCLNDFLSSFQIAGYCESVVRKNFGPLVSAMEYGMVPHGGLAFGLNRLAMILFNIESISDLTAFPISQSGHFKLFDGPRSVTMHQLKELGIKLDKSGI